MQILKGTQDLFPFDINFGDLPNIDEWDILGLKENNKRLNDGKVEGSTIFNERL